MSVEIKVSLECYNEIANALEQLGKKVNRAEPITIEKDDSIKNPIDFRLAAVRKDAMSFAVANYQREIDVTLIKHADNIYNFILKGTVPEISQGTPTAPVQTKSETKRKSPAKPIASTEKWT